MSAEFENFKRWYVDVLALLYPIRDAGIAVLMLSFLCWNGTCARKIRAPSDDLSDGCMIDLCSIFNALPNRDVARQFWNVYRNGFLHQVTLSSQSRRGTSLPVGWLTHDISVSVKVESDGSFWIQPVLYSQEVVKVIEDNFVLFSVLEPLAPTPSCCGPRRELLISVSVPPIHLSTRGGP